MTAPAHLQRCETCDNTTCEYSRDSEAYYIEQENLAVVNVVHNEWQFTALKGCASHSSVQSRDQVLDEISYWLNSQVGKKYFGFAEIRKKIRELRSTQGSRDP